MVFPSVSCMDFTKDHALVAVGTMESYIRVYSLDGKALKSKVASEKDVHVNNRKLIGHGGPVYGVCFSDSAPSLGRTLYEGDNAGSDTGAKMLLSCSADGQVRLWSLEAWACLCIYKAHDGPVFRVLWGPHGHYFATAGWDKTVRVFMQDHASAQRIMVGHDSSLSALAWHSNGTYVFSASDETDKSIRMWSVSTGGCVRVFSGHTDYISALECSPDGKILASADAGGNIYFWDIAKGTRIKRCRGHGKGGIPSLSFSAESNVLLSGGLDGTVRLWDVELLTDGSKATAAGASGAVATQQAGGVGGVEDTVMVGGQPDGRSITVGGQPTQPAAAAATSAGGGTGTGKKKGKEVQVTADQISAFATKKTPVMKVHFTRMNLAVAGGCYDPER
jgi:transcription initiation factor TFIID subunit 5